MRLIVGIGKAIAGGVASAVIADETGDDAFDVGAEGEISFGGVGVEIGERLALVAGVVAEEEVARAGRLGLLVTTLVGQGTARTLVRHKAKIPAIATL